MKKYSTKNITVPFIFRTRSPIRLEPASASFPLLPSGTSTIRYRKTEKVSTCSQFFQDLSLHQPLWFFPYPGVSLYTMRYRCLGGNRRQPCERIPTEWAQHHRAPELWKRICDEIKRIMNDNCMSFIKRPRGMKGNNIPGLFWFPLSGWLVYRGK